MFISIKNIISERFPKIQISDAIISGVGEKPQAIVSFLFDNNKNIPLYVVKISYDVKYNEFLEKECQNQLYIQNQTSAQISEAIAPIFQSGKINNHFFFVQKFCRGRVLPEQVNSHLCKRKMLNDIKNIQYAWDWLLKFQENSRTARDLKVCDFRVMALMKKYRAAYQVEKSEEDFFDQLLGKIEKMKTHLVPVAASHGDYYAGNILLNGKNIFVIDWRYYRENYHTIFDASIFISTFSLATNSVSKKSHLFHFQQLLFENNSTSQFLNSLINRFLTKNKLELSLFTLFFVLTLLELATRDFSSLMVVSQKDQVWREKLLFFLNNHKDFTVDRGFYINE
jgi:hypothetical protein